LPRVGARLLAGPRATGRRGRRRPARTRRRRYVGPQRIAGPGPATAARPPTPREPRMTTRRDFLKFAGGGALTAALAHAPRAFTAQDAAALQAPTGGQASNAVRTLNGWSLPYRMNDGVKEFHLVAE